MSIGKKAIAKIALVVGGAITFVKFVYDMYQHAQTVQGFWQDRQAIVEFLKAEWVGPAIAVASVVAYVAIDVREKRIARLAPLQEPPNDQRPILFATERQQQIRTWREMVKTVDRQTRMSKNADRTLASLLLENVDFLAFRPYLSPRSEEGIFRNTLIVPPPNVDMNGALWSVLDDIDALEREWGLSTPIQTPPDAMLAAIALFFDRNDPNCYQPDGRVSVHIGADGDIAHSETLYRLGVRNASNAPLRGCRVILEGAEPAPHDPGMHRIGLPMRPRIPSAAGLETFTVNPNAPAYVDVLQEIVREINPMHEWARIRLVYVNEDRGKANWFENGDYVLTFRLEGPIVRPVSFRLAVQFDGRRQHRRWRVSAFERG